MSRDDALLVIGAELRLWGKSLDRLPRYITLEQLLRIVEAA